MVFAQRFLVVDSRPEPPGSAVVVAWPIKRSGNASLHLGSRQIGSARKLICVVRPRRSQKLAVPATDGATKVNLFCATSVAVRCGPVVREAVRHASAILLYSALH